MIDFPYLNLHTHFYSAENPYSIYVLPQDKSVHDFESGLFSIGWHPWYLEENKEYLVMQKIKAEAQDRKVAAIGETGLDRLSEVPFDYQRKIFLEHIALSESVQKPLIIHCVKAFEELLAVKKSLRPKMPWIVHGYNNRTEIASQLLKAGIYFSFGKALQNPASNASQIIQNIEPSHFFLETDDSDVDISAIYHLASNYRNETVEVLKEKIYTHFVKLFKL